MHIQETRVYYKEYVGTQTYIIILTKDSKIWVTAVFEQINGELSGIRALTDVQASEEMTRMQSEGWIRIPDEYGDAPTGRIDSPPT